MLMTHEPPYPQYAEVVAIPLAQHGSGNAVPQCSGAKSKGMKNMS